MKIKSGRDFWSGLMFIGVGLGFAWGALNYSFGSSARPGPGYFPFGLGIILAVLGAILLFESLTVETEDGEPVGKWAWKPLLIILGSVCLFGILIPRAGMIISLPLLIFMASFADPEATWKGTLVSAFVLTLFSWLVFIKGLGLTIPLWPTFLGG